LAVVRATQFAYLEQRGEHLIVRQQWCPP
jgi:hypothetical protein